MRILKERPPNYAAIIATFPVVAHRRGVFFAYGDAIYNPDGVQISAALMDHEKTHAERQTGMSPDCCPDWWWAYYLNDPKFRLEEELIAHRVEWRTFLDEGHGRKDRRAYLASISARLASPLYGSMITAMAAKRIIGADT